MQDLAADLAGIPYRGHHSLKTGKHRGLPNISQVVSGGLSSQKKKTPGGHWDRVKYFSGKRARTSTYQPVLNRLQWDGLCQRIPKRCKRSKYGH